ncbi:hypothetical protein EAG_06487 [Camponotus floridanus]|uniref:Uncharacterized protein n=1 Tax=Camponotus floridanus TaxID=104421 RepID=E1ZYE6_CAMFO|nr:hypothetical protein EAG_06487 [Camponotus floridanus]
MSRNVIGLLGTRRGRWKSRRRNDGNSRVDETGGNGESTGGDPPRTRKREVSAAADPLTSFSPAHKAFKSNLFDILSRTYDTKVLSRTLASQGGFIERASERHVADRSRSLSPRCSVGVALVVKHSSRGRESNGPVSRPVPRRGDDDDVEATKIRETRGRRASLNGGDRSRGEDKGGYYSFKLWWPSFEWSRSCKTETARCQAASLERACWNSQERARTLWGLQQSFAAAANRNLFLHPASAGKSWLAETIVGADEARISPITTYYHSYPFVPGGAVPLPPPLLNGINNPAAATITPGLERYDFLEMKPFDKSVRQSKLFRGVKEECNFTEISFPVIFPLKGENCEFPRDSGELRSHILRFLEAGKCTPNIPVMYPAGEVTEVPIANEPPRVPNERHLNAGTTWERQKNLSSWIHHFAACYTTKKFGARSNSVETRGSLLDEEMPLFLLREASKCITGNAEKFLSIPADTISPGCFVRHPTSADTPRRSPSLVLLVMKSGDQIKHKLSYLSRRLTPTTRKRGRRDAAKGFRVFLGCHIIVTVHALLLQMSGYPPPSGVPAIKDIFSRMMFLSDWSICAGNLFIFKGRHGHAVITDSLGVHSQQESTRESQFRKTKRMYALYIRNMGDRIATLTQCAVNVPKFSCFGRIQNFRRWTLRCTLTSALKPRNAQEWLASQCDVPALYAARPRASKNSRPFEFSSVPYSTVSGEIPHRVGAHIHARVGSHAIPNRENDKGAPLG